MLKIVVPLTGSPSRGKIHRSPLPLVLTEIDSQPLLETIVSKLRPAGPHHFIFVTTRDDARRWAIDDVVRQIAPGCSILIAPSAPASPVFATLLAIDEIESEDELLVADSSRIFEGEIDPFLSHARRLSFEGCLPSFRCTHPKWNYLREEQGEVLQVVERRPVSDQAAASAFWLRRARDYFDAAEQHVVRHLDRSEGEETNTVVNELVLAGRRIGNWRIPSRHSAPSMESAASNRSHKLKSTHNFIDS